MTQMIRLGTGSPRHRVDDSGFRCRQLNSLLSRASPSRASAARHVTAGTSAGQFCGARMPEMVRAGPRHEEAMDLPAWQLQRNGQSCFPYLPREELARLRASAGVTEVTGYSHNPSMFWTRIVEDAAGP